ncbi:uncharacterized protein I303_100570 [Kwoniella dejecticola CBS 10117]|uniref:Prenylcysteine oxidase/farnesylcysteine lyase n=1 Tax=Kwoniella dejecticola CBS 10117 TaxID=1296121 RepID=A0A1A6AFC7_9TREE|nr:prenylcysteine oxidase/farnesylcysteine lyase [Kwoniella dejecticola CBS 10117]OBR88754.1 prenylcysteine oxidase/farnesylcysteine lyase [Kwoniella dejecticola CBS 10117]
MSLRTKVAATSLLFILTVLLLQPFHHHITSSIPFLSQEDKTIPIPSNVNYTVSDGGRVQDRPKRVAIVGAGASGSAAAFFLRRAARVVESRLGLEEGSRLGEIVVFEKEGYVGGRSTTVYPHSDPRLRAQELGGSIFVEANRNMMKGVRHFNLTLIDPDMGESGIGIWDGSQFLFTTSSSSWIDSAKALWRYGPMSPYRTKSAVSSLVNKFLKLYDPAYLAQRGPVESVENFAESLGLGNEITTRTGEDWAKNVVKVGDKWLGEIWEGSTRVNYASDMNQIHGLGAGVSMATGGASQVEGGNWQIFRGMIDDSKATIHLGTEVSEIVPVRPSEFIVVSNKTEINTAEPFDVVIFAAPWHSSPIKKDLSSHFAKPIPKQKYVHLHVTYFTTTQPRPLPSFFGLPDDAYIPNTILTTGMTSRDQSVPPPRFQSISWHGEVLPGSGEYAVKVFSITRLSDRFIQSLIGEEPSWLLRKEWDSYPKLSPIASYAPVEPIKGLHYLAAQEAWISTMETQTVSGREAVARIVNEWWGLGLGECENGDSWDWTCSP